MRLVQLAMVFFLVFLFSIRASSIEIEATYADEENDIEEHENKDFDISKIVDSQDHIDISEFSYNVNLQERSVEFNISTFGQIDLTDTSVSFSIKTVNNSEYFDNPEAYDTTDIADMMFSFSEGENPYVEFYFKNESAFLNPTEFPANYSSSDSSFIGIFTVPEEFNLELLINNDYWSIGVDMSYHPDGDYSWVDTLVVSNYETETSFIPLDFSIVFFLPILLVHKLKASKLKD